MNGFLFGVAAGAVVALAGTSMVTNPWKFLVLSCGLVVAHVLTGVAP